MTTTTEAAARVRAFCAIWAESPMFTEVDRVMGISLHITDLRALLAAHDAQAAEIATLRKEKADQHKAMSARIAAQRKEIRWLTGWANACNTTFYMAIDQRRKQDAEIARLRAALKRLYAAVPSEPDAVLDEAEEAALVAAMDAASAALKGGDDASSPTQPPKGNCL